MPKENTSAFERIEQQKGTAGQGPVSGDIHKAEEVLGQAPPLEEKPEGVEPPKVLTDTEKHALHEALAVTIANVTYPAGGGTGGRPATKEEFIQAMKGVAVGWDAIGFIDCLDVINTLSKTTKLIIGVSLFAATFLTYHPTMNWGTLLGRYKSKPAAMKAPVTERPLTVTRVTEE